MLMSRALVGAARSLRRAPIYTGVVVASLGFAMAASIVAYRTVDTVFLRPPVSVVEPDQIGRLYFRQGGVLEHASSSRTSYLVFKRLREVLSPSQDVTAYYTKDATVVIGDAGTMTRVALVAENYFSLLGTRPYLGRLLDNADRIPMASSGVVVSHAFWRDYLGGDPARIGSLIEVDGRALPVIGVAPPGFLGVDARAPVHLWISTAMADAVASGRGMLESPSAAWVQLLVRRSGTTRLNEELRVVSLGKRVLHELNVAPESAGSPAVEVGPLVEARGPHRTPDSEVLIWVVAVTVMLLGAACVNVAGLALTRAIRGQQKLAVQAALGATPSRLLLVSLVEALVLVVAGIVTAIGLSALASTPVAHFFGVPELAPLDRRTLVVLSGVASIVFVVVAVVPMARTWRANVPSVLRARWGDSSQGARRLRTAVLLTQAALACMLVAGALAFGLGLKAARSVDLGFQPDNVIGVALMTRALHITAAQRSDLLARVEPSLGRTPGVTRVSLAVTAPFQTRAISAVSTPGGHETMATEVEVDSGFFQTLRMPLRRGRAFSAADRAGAARVVVVNEALARQLWPGRSPLGQCLISSSADDSGCARVIGEVKTAKFGDLQEEPSPAFYVPLAQVEPGMGRVLLIRHSTSQARIIAAVRAAFAPFGVRGPALQVIPISQGLEPQLRPVRVGAAVFAVLGGLALLLVTGGVYAVVALVVTEEQRSLGIRRALGASARSLTLLVLRRVGLAILSGAAIGIVLCLIVSRWSQPILPLWVSISPSLLIVAMSATTIVALIGGLIPARKAAAIDPAISMRAT